MSSNPLESARLFLASNPPNGANRAQRLPHLAAIQAAADLLTPQAFADYRASWHTNPTQADAFESQHPILHYLRQATDAAIDEIQSTTVTRGLVAWHLYNMGFVFKSPTATFGIDICLRDAAQLVPLLDFLLITHSHPDHYTPEFLDAMLAAHKPVITSFYPGTTLIPLPAPTAPIPEQRPQFTFDNTNITIDIGDHHPKPDQLNNMLMFQIDTNASGRGADSQHNITLYHAGDGCNYHKMRPDRPIDLFMLHVAVGNMKVEDAIAHLNPRFTLGAHVLELGHYPHPPRAWRWSYDYAYNTIKNTPEQKADIPTWGQRWQSPSAILA